MKPQKQTIIHDPENGKVGNCLQACLSSLLDMDIDEVPHFAAHRGPDWFDRMNDWLLSQGYWILTITAWDNQFTPHGYCIANGTSPRGIKHSVIAKDGSIVFDPHPDNTGLREIDSYWLVIKVLQ